MRQGLANTRHFAASAVSYATSDGTAEMRKQIIVAAAAVWAGLMVSPLDAATTRTVPSCNGGTAVPDAATAIRMAGQNEVRSIRKYLAIDQQAEAIQSLGSEEEWQRIWLAELWLRTDIPESD